MIGKAYVSTFKYYDMRHHRMAFKNRPVLIIGQADSTDYVVLPVSRVTRKENIDDHYDLEIKKEDYPFMNLTETSYIRTHKQSVVNEGELTREITDFKKEYPETYKRTINLVKEFQTGLVNAAVSGMNEMINEDGTENFII